MSAAGKYCPALFLRTSFLLLSIVCASQPKGRQSIFAHNDYLKSNPFHDAYAQRVGFIEVDVFLKDNKLMVAHTRSEIRNEFDIEVAYLKPLSEHIEENSGNAYQDSNLKLHLMVDVKTEAVPTLQRLISILDAYPVLTNCKNLFITISGNMPKPIDWAWVPAFIYFDGRPGISYDPEQLKRVPVISSSFRSFSSWNGKKKLSSSDRARLLEAITSIHLLGKPVRFWATPDNPHTWQELSALGVDIINTDDVAGAVEFLEK